MKEPKKLTKKIQQLFYYCCLTGIPGIILFLTGTLLPVAGQRQAIVQWSLVLIGVFLIILGNRYLHLLKEQRRYLADLKTQYWKLEKNWPKDCEDISFPIGFVFSFSIFIGIAILFYPLIQREIKLKSYNDYISQVRPLLTKNDQIRRKFRIWQKKSNPLSPQERRKEFEIILQNFKNTGEMLKKIQVDDDEISLMHQAITNCIDHEINALLAIATEKKPDDMKNYNKFIDKSLVEFEKFKKLKKIYLMKYQSIESR